MRQRYVPRDLLNVARNPETAKLFYSKERTDLAMYDCTRELIPGDMLAGAETVEAWSPNLTSRWPIYVQILKPCIYTSAVNCPLML